MSLPFKRGSWLQVLLLPLVINELIERSDIYLAEIVAAWVLLRDRTCIMPFFSAETRLNPHLLFFHLLYTPTHTSAVHSSFKVFIVIQFH